MNYPEFDSDFILDVNLALFIFTSTFIWLQVVLNHIQGLNPSLKRTLNTTIWMHL